MASVQASFVLARARMLLDDIPGTTWSDAALLPILAQAHDELQTVLRAAAVPIMRGEYTETLAASITSFVTPPTDLVQPIVLWERAPADAINLYTLMTEFTPEGTLPNVLPGTTLVWWAWKQDSVQFIGASASRVVKMQYQRSISLPASNTDLIYVTKGELYLAPRVAAIAAGTVGNTDILVSMSQLAKESLSTVLIANKGRAIPTQGVAIKA